MVKNPINEGMGGRPPLPSDIKRKRRLLWLTDDEWEMLQPFVSAVRATRPTVPKKPRPQDAFIQDNLSRDAFVQRQQTRND